MKIPELLEFAPLPYPRTELISWYRIFGITYLARTLKWPWSFFFNFEVIYHSKYHSLWSLERYIIFKIDFQRHNVWHSKYINIKYVYCLVYRRITVVSYFLYVIPLWKTLRYNDPPVPIYMYIYTWIWYHY